MATPSLNSIQSVGVIGAGQMGSGIAHVCALAGYDVKIADLNEQVLQKAITSIDKLLEVIVAPSYAADALDLLKTRWKNVRLLEVGPVSTTFDMYLRV